MSNTAAALTRIDLALAANESADAVAWLEADFEEKYAAYLAGEWWPSSHHVRPMFQLLDQPTATCGMPIPRMPEPAPVREVATLQIFVDLSGFQAAMQRMSELLAVSFEDVRDGLTKVAEAFASPPADQTARLAAMRAAYDRRRRARRRRNRR